MAPDVPQRPARTLLNPHGLTLRQNLLGFGLCLALSLLIVDRSAAYLYAPSADSTAILLVSSPTCPHSRAARDYLVERGVRFDEVGTRSHPLRSGLAGWALQSVRVPIVVVGPDVIYGNRRDQIDRALAKLGYDEVAAH